MRLRRIRRAALLTAIVIAAGSACENESIFGPMVEGDVAEQREVWVARAIDDYDIRVTYFNEWVGAVKSVVEVRGGEVTGCREASTMQPRHPSEWAWTCPSVDYLFDDVETREASTDDWQLEVKYDASLGLIRTMRADVPGWADEAYGYAITDFQRR